VSLQIGDVTRVSGSLGRFWIIDETPPATPTMHEILNEVAGKHRVTVVDLRSDRKGGRIGPARMEAYFRCATETFHSYPAIGRFFRRDHTAVLYGARRHAKRNGLALGDRESVSHRRGRFIGC
jgi:hypothetical protein